MERDTKAFVKQNPLGCFTIFTKLIKKLQIVGQQFCLQNRLKGEKKGREKQERKKEAKIEKKIGRTFDFN